LSSKQTGASAKRAPQWEGQVLDGRFPLKRCLGGTVFSTEYEGQPAAVKVVTAGGRTAERLLSRWRLASKVSHPHLIRLLEMGRTQVGFTEVVYLVMEYAEENLAQVLVERALTPAEAEEMLAPALDALAAIHRDNFIHGRLTPSNIMAAGDSLKVSADTLRRGDDVDDLPFLDTAYRSPEVVAGAKPSPASDIWSLGVTLVETLTQHRPVWTERANEPVLPAGIRPAMREAVRAALRPSVEERSTAAQLLLLLAGQTPVPKRSRLGWYAIAAAAILVIAGVWIIATRNAAPAATKPAPAPLVIETATTPAEPVVAPPARKSKTREPEPARVPTLADVTNQMMPEVSDAARRSIHGTVTVIARVHADSYGAVTEASIEPPAHSRYFSKATLKAVRKWKFRPVKNGETFVPQEWLVRFEYSNSDTKVALDHPAK
jgi:TonB family protein